VSADADAWLDQASASANNGGDSNLKVRSKSSGQNVRALVRFALPASVPSGCVVGSATLRLYASAAVNGRTLQALRVTGSWSEGAVTWASQPGTASGAATTASGSAAGYREWNVTSQVEAIFAAGANNGFLIRDATENAGAGPEQQFHSREKAPDNPPQLVLTFSPAG
jgi:hypothetical protein